MKFFASAGRRNIEYATHLLQFALTTRAVDPPLSQPAIGSFELKRGNEELREIAGLVRLDDSALQPGQKVGSASAALCLQIGDDHNFKFKSLGLVNCHELNAALAVGGRVG